MSQSTEPAAEVKRYTAVDQYVIGYNIACFIGWAGCFAITWKHTVYGSSTETLYKEVMAPLKVVQTLALLEIVHAMIGLVRSPVFTTAQQVFSRIFLVWGILYSAPNSSSTGGITLFSTGAFAARIDLFSLLYAWSITEVIRYSFYAFKAVNASPYPLTWLRYTTFILLYPIGVASELVMAYLALPELRASRKWCLGMPNPVNMVFDYPTFCVLTMMMYAPGFPPMYMYMFKQRKKVLGGKAKSD